MVAFKAEQVLRPDIEHTTVGLMTDIEYLFRFRSSLGLHKRRGKEVAGPGLRVESGLPGNDCEYLYNLKSQVVCAAAHIAGRNNRISVFLSYVC